MWHTTGGTGGEEGGEVITEEAGGGNGKAAASSGAGEDGTGEHWCTVVRGCSIFHEMLSVDCGTQQEATVMRTEARP